MTRWPSQSNFILTILNYFSEHVSAVERRAVPALIPELKLTLLDAERRALAHNVQHVEVVSAHLLLARRQNVVRAPTSRVGVALCVLLYGY